MLFMDLLFFIVIGYYSFKFIQVLIKMKQRTILPTMNEELAAIRIHPEKTIDCPTYSKQKVGIIIYSFMLLFVIVMFSISISLDEFNWSFYLLLLLPFTYSDNLLNLFAVIDDGILCGVRFVAWRKIRSFYFDSIDVNHKYYGYSKEANHGYELKIKTRGFSINCIVTSDEMKGKLNKVLIEHVKVNEEESVFKELR